MSTLYEQRVKRLREHVLKQQKKNTEEKQLEVNKPEQTEKRKFKKNKDAE